MSRPSVLVWLMILLAGFAAMLWSYRASRLADELIPTLQAVIYVAESTPPKQPDPAAATPVLVYLLPPRPVVASLASQLQDVNARGARSLTRNHQEMAVLLPKFNDVFPENALASGRMPVPGATELLAGYAAEHQDQVELDGQVYQVVGMLRRDHPPLAAAYVLPDHPAHRARFDAANPSVKQGFFLFRARGGKLGEDSQFPKEYFTPVVGSMRLDRGTYYAYLAGMVLLVAGGSALLIEGYSRAAKKVTNRWLGPPLAELAQRKKLLVGLHLAYFGLCAAGALAIYEIPAVQDFLVHATHKEIESGSGPLRLAGEAYKSGNVARAAGVTLGINFFVGSVLMITLPSLVIPGIGILLALLRALMWGLLLAPTGVVMAGAMLPHGWTLLLEGEGYVLAAFFAVLVPVYLFRSEPDATVGSRYGRALVINLKGNLLVLGVLAVAAVYEAIEVIWQMAA